MSFKAKLFRAIIKYRHLFKGHIKPDVIDTSTSVEQLRNDIERAASKAARPAGVSYKQADYSALYAEWTEPENAPGDKAVLYFHGGGFVTGSVRSHRHIVGNFVRRLGVKALVFDYSLAPEHPAPAAVYDAVNIYAWLLKQGYSPENIAFVGDSAGGGIQFAAMVKCKDDGLPLPCACAAFSPCTDMTMSGESHRTRLKADPCTPKGANETYMGYYVGTGDPKHPYASPVFADLGGLPPVMIQVGDDETLRDDAVMLAKKAREDGVDVQLHIWQGLFHCFPLLAPLFPEATQALDETCAFLRKTLNLETQA